MIVNLQSRDAFMNVSTEGLHQGSKFIISQEGHFWCSIKFVDISYKTHKQNKQQTQHTDILKQYKSLTAVGIKECIYRFLLSLGTL